MGKVWGLLTLMLNTSKKKNVGAVKTESCTSQIKQDP